MSNQSMDGQLLMTQVGSLPKPGYILEARAKAHRGELPASELEELERRATREWIEFQDALGVDILVDGEMYRGDMVASGRGPRQSKQRDLVRIDRSRRCGHGVRRVGDGRT